MDDRDGCMDIFVGECVGGWISYIDTWLDIDECIDLWVNV